MARSSFLIQCRDTIHWALDRNLVDAALVLVPGAKPGQQREASRPGAGVPVRIVQVVPTPRADLVHLDVLTRDPRRLELLTDYAA